MPALQAGRSGSRGAPSAPSSWAPASWRRPTAAFLARRRPALVAYLDGEPVGWCAVEPRSAYTGLARTFRVPWDGRAEDKADDSVWAVTCFVIRAGFRRRGVSRALAQATVEFARGRGARAIEGYPMLTEPGREVAWGELHVGSRSIFAAAGFTEVNRPTPRRVVMRIDFRH